MGCGKVCVVLKTNYLVVNADYTEPPTAKYKRVLELREKGKDIQIMDAERFFSLSERQ